MNLKLFGMVKYRNIKNLIKRIQQKPKIEMRGRFLRKQPYDIYISSDGKYALAFKYKGCFHWGPTFYNLILESRENGNVIVKDFGSRIFVCDDYVSDYPWAEFCNKFYLREIEEGPDDKSSDFIKVYDADNNTETLVAENGENILAWSKKATHIIYRVYHKDNTVDVVITDLFNRRTINISKESCYLVFFDRDEKYIISIEENRNIILKIFTLLDGKLIYSQEIDLNSLFPKKKFFGIFIKKNDLFRADTSWFTVKFDKSNNNLYFGIPKKGSPWGPDYYKYLLWLKAELEF